MDTRRRRILIVDDNHAIHADFAKILGNSAADTDLTALEEELFADPAGKSAVTTFDVSSAMQGEEGLAMVAGACGAGAPYQMAFIDMRMPPGWDGVQTIMKIWEVDPEVQIVICTAYSDYSWDDILERLGVTDRLLLLKKPFDIAEVRQLAHSLTEKWNLARHARLNVAQLRAMVEEQTRSLEHANQRLQESEARYALAAAGSNDGLWDWDLTSDLVYLSPRWKAMLGHTEAEIGQHATDWFSRIHPEDRGRVERELDQHRSGMTAQFSTEYRILHKDGHYRWMLCRGLAVRDAAGTACRAAGSQTDITDQKAAEAQLRHDAFHDTLTGLPNRALLSERIERCLARQRRDATFRFAVMFVDLDHFKVVNDSLGHLVGDALLVSLARRFSSCVREVDTLALGEANALARIGGDEFVLLLEGIRSDGDALVVADRLQEAAARPFVIEGHVLHASLSIGIAIGEPGYERVEDVLRDADTALYRAKAEGRGCYRCFTEDLHVSAMARLEVENDLRKAIADGQLFLEYQPIVTLATGEVEDFEALVRWRHPTRGVIPPSEFIPLAEQTGLIVPLGHWVLEEACRQIHIWHGELPPGRTVSVAVNVASQQFLRTSFADEVVDVLSKTNVPASALHLEVTESSTMDSAALVNCQRLHELGIALHLDDFGTGYSSLSYLHRMPFRALKVDRSFISTIQETPMNESITRAIMTLASTLRISAVAEGVETAEQASILSGMGCALAQGHYWAAALAPAAAFEVLCSQPFRSTPRVELRIAS